MIHVKAKESPAVVYILDTVLKDWLGLSYQLIPSDIDGFEFVQYLSEHDEFKDVPVIFVSAIDLNNKTREKVENSNVKGFIPNDSKA